MFKRLTNHKVVSALCSVSLAFVLGGTVWAYFALRNIQSPLILQFNDMAGVVQIGGLGALMGAGILGTLIVILNSAIALELDPRDGFLSKFLATGTLVFAVLLFIAGAAIISVN